MENVSGIYKITNLINNKVYIGSSISCWRRRNQHKSSQRESNIIKTCISNAIKKYGWENFNFEIIEICDSQELASRELFWIKHFKSLDRQIGYNIAPDTMNNTRGVKKTPEQCKAQSDRSKGKFSGPLNPMYGKNHTEETKQKISETRKIKKLAAGENNSFYGKKHSEQTRKKMSESRKNQPKLQARKKIAQIDIVTGEIIKIWEWIGQIREEMFDNKILATSITGACNGKYKTSHGFKWKYIE